MFRYLLEQNVSHRYIYILLLFNCSLKFWSISLVFFISPSHSPCHFLWASSFATGSLQIPIPLVLRHEPQPNTAQLAPGITYMFLSKSQPYTDESYGEILQMSHHKKLLDRCHLNVCTIKITWLDKNENKDIGLWRLLTFITSPSTNYKSY